jgi:ferritin-like metal-binding protein YciE
VVEVARAIRSQEAAIMRRIESLLPGTLAASMDGRSPSELQDLVRDGLAEAHAIELQSIELLRSGRRIVGEQGFSGLVAEHLAAERQHENAVEKRRVELDSRPSAAEEAMLLRARVSHLSDLGSVPDGTARYAAYLFAVQYLEIGAYEQLRRIAERAGDHETYQLTSRILREERHAADRLTLHLERSVGPW